MVADPVNDAQPGVLRVLQSRGATRAFYDKISKVYDLLADRSEEPVRGAGLTKLAAQAGEKVLEIGCGTGHCLVELARAVGPAGRVYGLDLSEGMLRQADELLRREQLAERIEARCGDAISLPYASESMDAAFMSFTLELFDTPEIATVLGECQRVLRRGGRIVVVGMSRAGNAGLLVHAFEWTHRHLPNFLDCRPIFVRRALEKQGFAIVDASLMHMWVPVEIVLAVK
jgi:ubiquinone/menaquinone biosynthesis C-methylase UbiE